MNVLCSVPTLLDNMCAIEQQGQQRAAVGPLVQQQQQQHAKVSGGAFVPEPIIWMFHKPMCTRVQHAAYLAHCMADPSTGVASTSSPIRTGAVLSYVAHQRCILLVKSVITVKVLFLVWVACCGT